MFSRWGRALLLVSHFKGLAQLYLTFSAELLHSTTRPLHEAGTPLCALNSQRWLVFRYTTQFSLFKAITKPPLAPCIKMAARSVEDLP
jgi:hypothetical protein